MARATDDDNVVPLAKKKRNPPPAPPTDKRPEIRLEPGENVRVIDQSVEALKAKRDIFEYASRLCVIHVTKTEEVGAITRPVGAVRVHYLDTTLLTEHMDNASRFLKYDGRVGDYRTVNAPRRVAEHILARGNWPAFPKLDGILEAPILWRGEVIDRLGYHQDSRFFLAKLPLGYSPLRDTPTPKDAEHALYHLEDSVSTFPHKTEADKSAHIAGRMSAVQRRAMAACPALAINANAAATGKTLTSRCMAELATGRPPALISLSGDEQEDEKRLAAALLAADPVVSCDNIEGTIGCPLLNSMITEPEVAVRVLGGSNLVRVPTNMTLILNGNNLAITRDLRRRVLLINLDAGCEKPEERVFSRDALAFVRENRAKLIRAVLTISLAYKAAGEPHVGTSTYGGFSEWDRLVRRPLVWLGLPDPLGPAQGLREIDPDYQATRSLFHQWFELFGVRGATSAEAITAARKQLSRADGGVDWKHPELREVLQQVASDRLDSRTLSAWLRRHRDRIVSGYSLRQGEDIHGHVARWTVIDCEVRRG